LEFALLGKAMEDTWRFAPKEIGPTGLGVRVGIRGRFVIVSPFTVCINTLRPLAPKIALDAARAGAVIGGVKEANGKLAGGVEFQISR
jgi:hypothetical protein